MVDRIQNVEPKLYALGQERKWKAALELLEPYANSTAPLLRGWGRHQQAMVLYLQSTHYVQQALPLIDEAIELLAEYPEQLASTLIDGTAMAEFAMDEPRYRLYIHAMRRLVDNQANIIGSLVGRCQMRLGYYNQRFAVNAAEAERRFKLAQAYYEQKNDQACQLRICYTALAELCLDEKRIGEAKHYLCKASKADPNAIAPSGIAFLRGRLAELEERWSDAKEHYRVAKAYAQTNNDHTMATKAVIALAGVHKRLGEYDELRAVVDPVIDALVDAEVPQLALKLQRVLNSIREGGSP